MIASLLGWGYHVILNAALLAVLPLAWLISRIWSTSDEIDRVVQQDTAGMDDGLSMEGEQLASEVEDFLRSEGGQAA